MAIFDLGTEWFLTILNLNVAPIFYLHSSFGSIQLTVCEMSFEEFQDSRRGGGYRNGTILAILSFHVARMPPTKFQLNPTYESGGDVKNVKR